MKLITDTKTDDTLVLAEDNFFLIFRWTGIRCVVGKCPRHLYTNQPEIEKTRIVFSWLTSSYNLDEVKKALYKILGKAFDYILDEDYEPIFREWEVESIESVDYYIDTLYEDFSK